ncbi:hypothetical protein TNCV_3904151 [Trichonephila clavipes]|nr:hypothetical protein TNCV_3904151 [Trichonephila clavipes]
MQRVPHSEVAFELFERKSCHASYFEGETVDIFRYRQDHGLSRVRFIVSRYYYSHSSEFDDCRTNMESMVVLNTMKNLNGLQTLMPERTNILSRQPSKIIQPNCAH